ncbi:hypothetical protein PCANC_20133 [Puccinia coronata f. sp. avenae]|uniref:Uncharacterized protein n=1 Tax=Puccinia coronata f. sp. avenae TaxID=200324 RepID=A0A2N5TWG9_9BASI|nr:hypothetical protein PCANC_20133 [Puccinia coronata f. sp. avenae]
MSHLPAVKQQLNNLLRAFGLGDEHTPSNSSTLQLAEALEIMTKFGPAMDHLESALESLSPWANRWYQNIDANDGMLKQLRCDLLRDDLLLLQYDMYHPSVNLKISGACSTKYIEYIRSGQLYPDPPSDHLEDDSKPKLEHQIVLKTAELCLKVDSIIECSTRSEFVIIQAHWKLWVVYMSDQLPRLTSTI